MMVSYTRNKDYDTMEDEIDANTESRPYVDGLDIPLQDNEWDQWSHSWEKTLIVTLMGKRANFKILENYIQKQWTKNGKVKLVDMEDGYFLVYFSTEADYIHALYEGPWMLADHYLLVQRWRKMFLQSAATMKKVAVWIRIPRLPLELYNDTFLTRIGNALGTMLKVDRLTRFRVDRLTRWIGRDVKPQKGYLKGIPTSGERFSMGESTTGMALAVNLFLVLEGSVAAYSRQPKDLRQ
ncbi:hypothetical protein L195_g025179 [Trifolium pratense]|uniref:DUF4283 domain-containing protein n=1 Tax=Trifolium pratense TaxID=57577 RepID=A0A2K3NFR8_TRIPR|nr:hypothetical protein L195_g025179 [Trifolium pratense]